MAEISLADVVERIRAEGQLQRNTGTNSLKSIKDILSGQSEIMSEGFKGLISAITSDALANKELKMENDRLNERLLQALEDLKNQGGGAGPEAPAIPLGGLGMMFGGALGGILGILGGQFKAIQAFAKLFTPEIVKSWFTAARNSIMMSIDTFKTVVSERVASLRAAMSSGFERLKSFFTFGEDSRIGKILGSISARISMFAETFRTAGSVISQILEGPLKALRSGFTFVKGLLSSFGNFVGRIAGIVGKIFAPIAIVLTLFETVKGAIDGYAESGSILGGLEGAITGFFNSLITKPLDLVKDAVAWVLEKFNWTEGADALNSFSFTDLFNNMIGGLFDFVGSAVEWVKTLFSNPVEALSQLWSGLYGEDGIFNTLIWKPVSMGINWVMEQFGWKEEGAPDFNLFTFVSDIWNTVVTKVKAGFESFANWLASIPAKLKLFAYESVRSIPGGDWIISDEALSAAQQEVAAFEVTPPSSTTDSAAGLESASTALAATQTEREIAAAENAGGNAQVGVDASTTITQRSDTVYVGTDLSARNSQRWANNDYDEFAGM